MQDAPTLIDTDGGVDDALALIFAMAWEQLRFSHVTTVHGNIPVDQATRNVVRVINLCRPEPAITFAAGCSEPLATAPTFAHDVHGPDGLGGVTTRAPRPARDRPDPRHARRDDRGAVRVILDFCEKSRGDGRIICIGPLTNLALAYEAAPEIVSRMSEVVIMGGAVHGRGNITPHAEFNFFADPLAAKIVLESAIPKRLAPLELCERHPLHRQDIARMGQRFPSRIAEFIEAISQGYADFYQRVAGLDGFYPHDVITVAAADRDIVKDAESHHLTVSLEEADRGAVVAGSHDGAPTEVCTELHGEAFAQMLNAHLWIAWNQGGVTQTEQARRLAAATGEL